MKKPKAPENPNFWAWVIANPKLVDDFQKRGNARSKRNLNRALALAKWNIVNNKREKKAIGKIRVRRKK